MKEFQSFKGRLFSYHGFFIRIYLLLSTTHSTKVLQCDESYLNGLIIIQTRKRKGASAYKSISNCQQIIKDVS